MNTITENYKQAELALAAYYNLTPGIAGNAYTSALKDSGKGMSPAQATAFAAKWSVVTQYTDSGTGLSATVFQEVATGKRYLAVRGTDPGLDFVADYFILNGLPSSLNPQYQSLKTQLQAWLADPTVLQGQSFTVAGHSLGGYLAAGLVADFGSSISQAYLYNAPGNNSLISYVSQALGFSTTPDASKITSLRADAGISPIAALGNDFSPPISIVIENQFLSDVPSPPGALNHSQRVLTDALAVYAVFSELAPTLSVNDMSALLKASSSQNVTTLESAAYALAKLFMPGTLTIAAENREALYTTLQSLQQNTLFKQDSGLVQLKLLGSSVSASVSGAETDIAYRYALMQLNPFVVTGDSALYGLHNTGGQLELYNETTGSGSLTKLYLQDRAAMLSWLNKTYTEDTDIGRVYDDNAWYFKDEASGKQVWVGNPISVKDDPLLRKVLFGQAVGDILTGSGSADRLYGGGGDDIVKGADGNDYLEGGLGSDDLQGGVGRDALHGGQGADVLEGGKGNDTLNGGAGYDRYILSAGDGYDTILDIDGSGVIVLNGVTLTGGELITATSNVWKNISQGITYTLKGSGADQVLLISKDGSSDGLRVQGWQSGQLGLVMTGAPAPSATTQIVGVDGYSDALTGGGGADLIQGLSGNDALNGSGGDDVIEGGLGDDLLAGSTGSDLIYGGAGKDMILSATGLSLPGRLGSNGEWEAPPSAGAVWTSGRLWGIYASTDANGDIYVIDGGGSLSQDNVGDIVFAEDDDDRVIGGLGADYIDGGLGNDNLTGQGGNDVIDGGEGDDYIQGDGIILPGYYTSVAEILHGNDVLDGGAGVDILIGGGRDDSLFGGTGNDKLWGDDQSETYLSGAYQGADYLDGGADDDLLTGGGSDDTLMGGAGDDKLWGDADDETELAGNYQGNDYLDGGEGNDQLVGGGGNDILVGGIGNDLLQGDARPGTALAVQYEGDDLLYGDAGDDQLAGGGGDDDLYGGDGADTLLGESGVDILDGDLGNDYLDGGTGADIMAGGADDDTYIVDDAGDVVIEAAGEGVDIINSSVTIALPDNIEWLNLTGTGNINATGNTDANNLTGNAGANRLEGMGGNDQIMGGEGDDILIGDEGIDALYGDAGSDTLSGGSGNDELIGGAGADSLMGGTGDDFYGVDDAGDTITEALGEGNDFVRSLVSYTLADNLEGLALDGAADLIGTGNALNNSLFGNVANNTLAGGIGNDYLFGDAGDDVYVFNRGDGQDSIENSDLLGATDTLRFGAGIADTDVLGFQVGTDMVLKIKGTTEQVAFLNYYGADVVNGNIVSDYKIDRVEFANGIVWDQAIIQTIVDRAANNLAPIVNTLLPALQAQTNNFFSYTIPYGTISDPDAWDSITYSVTMPDGSQIPSWLMFDVATNTLSGTPEASNFGSLQFMLWGTDSYGDSKGQKVTLNVGTPNRAPALTAALPDQNANQYAAFSYTVSLSAFSDPDAGDTLNYSATLSDGNALPSWLSFNSATRTFSGTPNTMGKISVQLTARDSGNLTATDVFDITVGGSGLILNGTSGADFLYGGAGNDIFDGGLGNDILQGLGGDDVYLFAAGDGQDLIGEIGGSDDILRFKAGIQPGEIKLLRWFEWDNSGNIEDSLRLIRLNQDGSSTQDFVHIKNYFLSADNSSRIDRIEFSDGTVWTYADIQSKLLIPTDGAETLEGFTGADVINGLGGNDSINGKKGDDTLLGGDGDDDLQGGLGNDTLLGGAGNDRLLGYGVWMIDTSAANNDAGDDILYGGTGIDSMFGGKGNDTYLFGRGDGYDYVGDTPNDSGPSTDVLRLAAGVLPEHVTLYRFATRDLMVVIDGSNQQILLANYYFVDSNGVGDWSIERIEFDGGAGPVWTAADIASRVVVGVQNSMVGTAGNDTFIVDHVNDTITESANAGVDTVLASQSYTLPTNVENITLTGVLNINATGNALNNIFRGNSGDNAFTGNGGNDIGYGGLGDDTYIEVTPVELENEGIDTWITIYGGTLPDNVENMYLNNGGSYVNGTVSAIGNALDNILIGRSVGVIGQDVLDGRAGADTMLPGRYTTVIVDNLGDKVIGAGYEIRSSVDYALAKPLRSGNNMYMPDSVTNRLALIGNSPINGIGNAINNVLLGNLNGASNTLWGGPGDDVYVVSLNDQVVEAVGEGNDVAYLWLPSALDNGREIRIADLGMENVERYVLAGYANNVTLRGDGNSNVLSSSLDFWGNYQSTLLGEGGSDRLGGGNGRDVLDGGTGADEMYGGAGNDVYIVDDASDRVVEYLTNTYSTNNRWEERPYYTWYERTGGTDLVYSSVTFALDDNVENLTLTGTDSINAMGNDLANVLSGNAYANILTGGAGNDTYIFGIGSGQDTINNYDVSSGKMDVVQFNANVASSQVQVSRSGNDLILNIRDTSDTLTILNYLDNDGSNPYTVEKIQFYDTTWDVATVMGLLGSNRNPLLSVPLADQTANEDSVFSFTVPATTFSDPDTGDTLAYNAILANGAALPSWLNFNAATRTFSGTPGNSDIGSLNVKVTATDQGGLNVSDVFALTVNNTPDTNSAPVVSIALADQSTNEDTPFSFTVPAGSFSDPDAGDSLAYSATQADGTALPTWLNFNAATRTFSGTPLNADVGSLNITVTATDIGGLSVSDIFAVTVANTNDAPVVSIALADQSTNEDTAFSFTVPAGSFTDPDASDTLTYSATLADGTELPTWLNLNAATRTFSGTPGNADVGSLTITVTATDTGGLAVSDNFAVTVANTNDAPVVSMALVDQSSNEDTPFSFTVPVGSFSDPDAGDSLAYSATLADGTALPSWLNFNAATRTFSGTPGNADLGSLNITVTATDTGGLSVSDNFAVTVANTNDAPVVSIALADQSANEDSAFSFTVPLSTFSDPDAGDTLTYSATLADDSALPSWLSFNPSTRTLSGTPGNSDIGSLNVKVTATDQGGLNVSDVFALTVNNTPDTNSAPVVSIALADQGTNEDTAFSFTVPAGSFSDPDAGDSLAYSATLSDGTALPSWLNFNAATRTFSGTPVNADVGNLNIKVTATDTGGLNVSDIFAVTVANTNDAPVVSMALVDQSSNEDSAFSFTVPGTTFSDPDAGDTLAYSATLADGTALPTWLNFNAATRTFSGTPGNADLGSLNITVTATDTGGLSVSDNFAVTVANTNDAPVVSIALADQSANEDSAFSFTVPGTTFSDPDAGDTLAYSATLADGTALPTWLNFNAATRTFSGTPVNADVGNLNIKVTATDTGGLNVSDIFAVTVVNTNDAPVVSIALADQSTNEDTAFSFTVPAGSFSDPDAGDSLAYNATLADGTPLPSWLNFNAATRTFSGTPLNADVGSLNISVTATDIGGLSVSDTFDLTTTSTSYTVIDGGNGFDTLDGSANNDSLNGYAGDDFINGFAGNDLIEGGAGLDTLNGGAGNDTFLVNGDSGADVVNGGSGVDQILGSNIDDSIGFWSYGGENSVERIDGGAGVNRIVSRGSYSQMDFSTTELINIARIDGNGTDDTITGSWSDDIIDGAGGRDVLSGGAGNDTFLVNGDSGADVVNGGTGIDQILGSNVDDNISFWSYGGESAVERIDGGAGFNRIVSGGQYSQMDFSTTELINIARIDGNGTDDTITGSWGDDIIEGGAGLDVLSGGAGNDTFLVNGDSGADVVNGGSGVDQILGSNIDDSIGFWSYGGENSVERIDGGAGVNRIVSRGSYSQMDFSTTELINIARIDGNGTDDTITGSWSDDIIDGAGGQDTLNGGAGNDLLKGGMGFDVLSGGTGNDTYILGRGDGRDVIVEEDSTAGNTDIAQFMSGVATDQIWFQKVGNNLETSIIGTSDKLVVKDWYLSSANRIEQFKTTDGGKTLLDSQVENLVNAMASFAPPAAGQTTLPQNYQTSLAPVIAANWQ